MYSPKYLSHTLNTSPSKQAHSFGKGDRFIYQRDSPRHRNNPEKVKVMTFGREREGVEREPSPSPTSYRIPSQFDNKSKGYSFGRIVHQKERAVRRSREGSPNKNRLNTTNGTDEVRRSRNLRESLRKASRGGRMYQTWKEDKYGYHSPNRDNPGPGSYKIFSIFGNPDRY